MQTLKHTIKIGPVVYLESVRTLHLVVALVDDTVDCNNTLALVVVVLQIINVYNMCCNNYVYA